MIFFLLSIGAALTISALCSLVEAVLLSLPSSYVGALSGRRPRIAHIWKGFKENIEKPIAVILIINTSAHTIGATVAGAQFETLFGDKWLLLFSLIFTYLMLQFTEILPKTIGVRFNRQIASSLAQPLYLLVKLLSPVLSFIHWVNRPFAPREFKKENAMEEIAALAVAARYSESMDAGQTRMILAASRLDTLRVRQVMTPRTKIVFLRLDQPIDEIIDIVMHSPYTRLPLCEKDVDNIIGFIHVRDLFAQLGLVPGRLDIESIILASGRTLPPVSPLPGSGLHVIGAGSIDLRKIRRELLYVPEHISAQNLLKQFQSSHIHMAAILDEYGVAQGIVTLEDILEEIVGDIEDEYDRPGHGPVRIDEEGYHVHGDVSLHALQDHLLLPEEMYEDSHTVGGYLTKILGKIPQSGDTILCGPYRVRVLSADERRVGEVVFEKLPESAPEE